MEMIDGWEVDEVDDRDFVAAHTDGSRAVRSGDRLEIWDPDERYNYLPVRVARILLGDRSEDPQGVADAATMTNEEGAEIIADLLGAVAALTGTELEGCAGPCAGHPSAEAWSQVRCAEVGQVAAGALPWRPSVGNECFYFVDGEWRRVNRIEDYGALQCFALLDCSGAQFDCDANYDGIRPIGSLPAPASARPKIDALPWRPKVGEDCHVWHSGHWLKCRRCEDGRLGALVFWYAIDGQGFEFNIAPELLNVRPIGSLPVPASVRAKTEES